MFKGLHYPLTWSNGFSCGRGQKGALLEKGKHPWQGNVVIVHFYEEKKLGKENEDKRRQENGQT